jgi:hypothetical protein
MRPRAPKLADPSPFLFTMIADQVGDRNMGHALSKQAVSEARRDGGDKRLSVLLGGLVLCGDDHFPVRVRALSPGGAWVEASTIPAIGSIVRFSRGLTLLTARVVRIERGGFELMFRDPLDAAMLHALLGTPAPPADEDSLPLSKH